MKNKNLYIMKQPDLGKKILELRKSKGLTQEELVEKCNINVRTIQRIEAGDVTPRSFTIKTILEVLGVEADAFFGPEFEETNPYTKEDKSILTGSWIAGIFVAIFSVVGIFIEISILADFENSKGDYIPTLSWSIPFLIALFFFLRGYHRLGKLFQNNVLISASYLYFILEIVILSVTLIASLITFETYAEGAISVIIVTILFGIGELILGIGIMRLKDQLGSFANLVGIAKIVNGAMLITVILSPIGSFLSVAILILEVILLYNFSQKMTQKP